MLCLKSCLGGLDPGPVAGLGLVDHQAEEAAGVGPGTRYHAPEQRGGLGVLPALAVEHGRIVQGGRVGGVEADDIVVGCQCPVRVGIGTIAVVVRLGEGPFQVGEAVAMAKGGADGGERLGATGANLSRDHRHLAPGHGESGVELHCLLQQFQRPGTVSALIVLADGFDVLAEGGKRRRRHSLQRGTGAHGAERLACLLAYGTGHRADGRNQVVLTAGSLTEAGEFLARHGRDQPGRDHVTLSQLHHAAVEHCLGAFAGGDFAGHGERHVTLSGAVHQLKDLEDRGTGEHPEVLRLGEVGAEGLGDDGPEGGVGGGRPEVGDDQLFGFIECAGAAERRGGADAHCAGDHEAEHQYREGNQRGGAAEPGAAPRDVGTGLERQRGHGAVRHNAGATGGAPRGHGVGALGRVLDVGGDGDDGEAGKHDADRPGQDPVG